MYSNIHGYLDTDHTTAQALLVHLPVRLMSIISVIVLDKGKPITTMTSWRDLYTVDAAIPAEKR